MPFRWLPMWQEEAERRSTPAEGWRGNWPVPFGHQPLKADAPAARSSSCGRRIPLGVNRDRDRRSVRPLRFQVDAADGELRQTLVGLAFFVERLLQETG